MRVLLTDGEQRSTLAAVRALGAAGIDVYVAETASHSLASRSRYCKGTLTYPSPYAEAGSFARAIDDAATRLGVDVIIPMTDITSAILAEQRDNLTTRAQVAVMDAETFWRASDKNSLHRLAQQVGVPTPTLHYIEHARDVDGLDVVAFPCVVKPSRSRLHTIDGWIKTSVEVVASRDELRELFRTKRELQHPAMIQRYVEGDGIGVFALCDHGEPRALFAHRRLREKPPWGGVSVLREAVPVDPIVADLAVRLLRELRWHGVAMVEFRRERSTGVPFLMEINGRFWGSLQLSIDAGLNFPLHLVRLLTGDTVPVDLGYRAGVRSRWLLGDLDHVLMRISSRNSTPVDAPSLGALLLDFCNFFRSNTRLEVESLRDPRPSLHEIRCYIRDLLPIRRVHG